MDVLGLLKTCQKQGSNQGPPFSVPWAGHPGTQCPPGLKLAHGPLEMLAAYGPRPILAGTRLDWAWGNLLQAGGYLVQYGLANFRTIADHVLGKQLMDMSLQVFFCLPLLFVFAHHVLLWPFSKAYRALPMQQRLVTCQHTVYAIVFGVSLVPQTVMASEFLFSVWTGDKLMSGLWSKLIALVMSRCGLYSIESGVRAVKWSWVLVAHHLLFLALLTQNVIDGNPVLGVVGVVLDLFACHEAPLYVALIAYRLRAPIGFTRGVLRFAVAWYIVTRVLQTAILGYQIGHWFLLPQINRDPAFIGTAVLCVALTVIQAYTVKIYWSIDRKLAAQKRVGAAADDGVVVDAAVVITKRRGAKGGRASTPTQPEQNSAVCAGLTGVDASEAACDVVGSAARKCCGGRASDQSRKE